MCRSPADLLGPAIPLLPKLTVRPQLITVAFLTVIFLTATIVFHLLTGLSPRVNLGLNSLLLAIWVMGFGMLTYWTSPTLGNRCDTADWSGSGATMVCKIYKALFAFCLLGL